MKTTQLRMTAGSAGDLVTGFSPLAEQNNSGPVPFRQFLVARVEICLHRFGQSYISRVVCSEVMAQFPNTVNQRRVRITFRRQPRKPCLKSIRLICPDSATRRQPSECAHHFDINQMRNDNRLIHFRELDSDRIGQWAVRKKLDNHRRVQNDHRESRSSRITCEALRSPRTGLICRVVSSHSCIVGRSAERASSLLRKSERLMPSRAARDFKMRCTFSGTSLT